MSQQSKTTLQSAINTQIADNTSGDISAADIRDNLINITDSLLFNTGSGQAITGSLTITEGITGSLLGTASYATQALSASWAPSVASNPFPFTGSAIISGSLTVTGSINNTGSVFLGKPDQFGNRNINVSYNNSLENVVLLAGSGGASRLNKLDLNGQTGTSTLGAENACNIFSPVVNVTAPTTNITGSAIISGSLVVTGSTTSTTGFTGSLLGTASYATQALSASWAPSVASNPFPFTGSAIISGSLAVSGGLILPTIPENNTNVSPYYGYMNLFSNGGIHVRDQGDYNNWIVVDTPYNVRTRIGAGMALLLGSSPNNNGISMIVADSSTGVTENSVYAGGTANFMLQSETQLILSGSSSKLTLSGSAVTITGTTNINGLMTLQPANPLPSVTNGSIAYSSSGDFYFGSGSAWRKLTL